MIEALVRRVREAGLHEVRIAWADLHGTFRAKSIVCRGIDAPLGRVLEQGVGLVSTLLLKDTADRTAFDVFGPGASAALPGLAGANNLVLKPDPASFVVLPWAPDTGWLRADLRHADGAPVEVDPRRVLQRALARLAARGLVLRCGLEVEFHLFRTDPSPADPRDAAWPPPAPRLSASHPGYQLLSEAWMDRIAEPMAIVRRTALDLGMPLASLEVELGPSQVEAVFDPDDALVAADRMLLFRSAVRQALARAGWHASFCCKPPFPNHVASGWHLHHAVADAGGGNRFAGGVPLSPFGRQWLAGLLAHARGMAALAACTVPAYSRFRASVMAPQAAVWGRDNRGAMLRVVGEEAATRIENRLGEPTANPYLYIAAQVFAGLDGVDRGLDPGAPTEAPYADLAPPLPATLAEALDALQADVVLAEGLDAPMLAVYDTVKRHEWARWNSAEDKADWEAREYLARY